jgi:hypothetical protein
MKLPVDTAEVKVVGVAPTVLTKLDAGRGAVCAGVVDREDRVSIAVGRFAVARLALV